MSNSSAQLARSTTWKSSKQSYLTVLLLVDSDLADDCYRAYAYFRWADDVIDDPGSDNETRIVFVQRQRELIELLYAQEMPPDLTPEEMMVADLIHNDRMEDSGLRSFIHNFFSILEFDALRKGSLINQEELDWYSESLGKAVTDAIQYFIRNGHPYPDNENRYQAATAAHMTHMLRDLMGDIPQGYINIPIDILERYNIDPEELDEVALQSWVQTRVNEAHDLISKGKLYLDELDVLRCKIAGYWYCARFETILHIIESEDFLLRREYDDRRKLINWLKMGWIAASVTAKHYTGRITKAVKYLNSKYTNDPETNLNWNI